MSAKSIFIQALKFGASGMLGVSISAVVYYSLRGSLPRHFVTFWFMSIRRFDLVDGAYYLLTSIIGGSVHFALSKVWVFDTK
ncbi:MAG: hypothetical protein ABSF09_07835 [Candidatus Bathyarchaeia archaeon]